VEKDDDEDDGEDEEDVDEKNELPEEDVGDGRELALLPKVGFGMFIRMSVLYSGS